MAEIGQVTKVNKDEVVVRLMRQEACAKCGACSAGLESKDMFIHAINLCHAKEDDFVEIELEEANFIKAVFIMYGIPLIGLLIGIAIGEGLGFLFFEGLHDILGIIMGILGALAVYLFIRLNEKRFHTEKYKPVAKKIV